MIVGQNIKFDLHYLMKEINSFRKNLHDYVIWDTALAEYILTGQQSKFMHLNDLAAKYGGTLKDENIKEYWEAGVSTEDIPEEEILPYLQNDVWNTEKVFLAQWEKAKSLGMIPLLTTQMSALLATTEMEFNGMYFDIRMAHELAEDVSDELKDVTQYLVDAMAEAGIEDPNPSSNEQISCYIFGGFQKYEQVRKIVDEEGNYVRFKSGAKKGEVKTKKFVDFKPIDAKITSTPQKDWETQKADVFKTGDEIIRKLLSVPNLKTPDAHLFLRQLLKYRELTKDLNTYYIGYSKLFWPHDQCIHGKLQHNATNTGRLSSSQPNLQNLSN
jgi:DNA polymerase I-like protein with 3'-5' exonuclease and polymerase domains